MIIHRITVRNFRKLVGPLVVDNLGPGLTIIEGENEEGKSTLLQCIRCAFFDKHNVSGQRAASFQPYNSTVRPEIQIDFELNGQNYKLFKAFCQRQEATLTTPKGQFSGDAAEDELEKLLRFTRAKRARRDDSDHEHEGIFGMFWVEQGKSFTSLDPNEDGRSTILQALQKEVGDVLGGKRGQKILAEVSRRRSELQTSTGRPKGEFAEAANKLLAVDADLAKLNKAIAEHATKADELERYRDALKRHEQGRSVDIAEDRVRKAAEASANIERIQRTLHNAENAFATAVAEQKLAANKAEARANLVAEVDEVRGRIESSQEKWEQKRTSVEQLTKHLNGDEEDVRSRTEAFETSERNLTRAEAVQAVRRIDSDLAGLEAAERSALTAKEHEEIALAEAKTIAIEKSDVAALEQLEKELARSQAQLEAIATNVRVTLESDVTAEFDGVKIASATERKVTKATTLRILNCAEVAITPGGDVANPRAQMEQSSQNLRLALSKLSVGSVSEAQSKLDRRVELLGNVETARQMLKAYAPEGLEVLHRKILDARSDKARLLNVAGDTAISVEGATSDVSNVRKLRDEAKRDLDIVSQRAQQTRHELGTMKLEEASSKAEFDADTGQLRRAEERLSASRKQASDLELHQQVIHAVESVGSARVTVEAAKRSLKEADPETVARELQIAKKALETVNKEIKDLENAILRLETELRMIGAMGLGERKQELEAEHVFADTTHKRLERKARVIELLYDVLVEAEREAKETFLRPVTQRVQPYLKIMLPGTELKLDENMQIVGLLRGTQEEKFEDLSIGTREQLAVVTRLAFADLLRERGQPAAVLLDDAIVFADDRRFDRMIHVLHKAAERLQVIVLTCRERDYLSAGAPIIHLRDCYVAASSASNVGRS